MQPAEQRDLEIAALRERLSRLSQASLRITEDLDLDAVLQRVVDGARLLTGASRGGLTVIDGAGQFQDFFSSGLTGGGPPGVRGVARRTGPLRLPGQSARTPAGVRLGRLHPGAGAAGNRPAVDNPPQDDAPKTEHLGGGSVLLLYLAIRGLQVVPSSFSVIPANQSWKAWSLGAHRLEPAKKNWVMLDRPVSELGRAPLRSVFWIASRTRLERLPISVGKAPLRSVSCRDTRVREDNEPSQAGIDPFSPLLRARPDDAQIRQISEFFRQGPAQEFRFIDKRVKLDRLPSAPGISPVRELRSRASTSRLVMLPSTGGNSPERLLLGNSTLMTWLLPLVVTPCHWPRGWSLSHPDRLVQEGPPVAR